MKKFFDRLPSLYFVLLTFIFIVPSSILGYSQDKDYDAVYLRLKKEYTLNPDGSMDYRYIKDLKLQTYQAFQNLYGESFIVYNPDFQRLKVNDASTIMADGTKSPSPANAYNEVLPAFAANAPAYNSLREMVVTHTGTERGAILHLDYMLHSNKGFYPCLMGNELLCEVEPVKEMTFIVRVPADNKLNYSVLNTTAKPVITDESGFRVYTWVFPNVQPISAEDFQKGDNGLYPRILFSTATNRTEVYNDFLKQEAFSYGIDDDMKNAVAALSKDNNDKTGILLKLQDNVVNDIRSYPVPLQYCGFRVRTAQETWNSNGGTPMEKAVLLTALLKEAGISASPAFMIRNSLYDESVGSMMDIEDVLVRAELPGNGPVYLSVTHLNPENLFDSYPERVFVILDHGNDGNPELHTERSLPLKNQANLTGTFTINDNEQLSGEISLSGNNALNPYLMLLRDKNLSKSLVAGGISSYDLKDPDITKMAMDQSSVVFTVHKDKAMTRDSDYYSLRLPGLTNGIESLGIHLLPKERSTPFEIESLIEENDDFTFLIPGKMKPFIPNEKNEMRNNAGVFSFDVKTKGGKIVVHKSLKLEKRLIQPAEYAEFKTLMDHWNAERYREVVLVK